MIQNKPLVTIVVISYNQGKYIRENLDSIKNQTYPNIELIVGDDASPDNSVEVFENWLTENNYPTTYKNYHTQNTGLATMLNECIAKANGKYIKLIAADDYLHQEYIECCLNSLINNDAGVVFTQAIAIDDNGVILDNKHFNIPENPLKDLEMKLSRRNFVSGSTLFFKKESYLKIGNIPSAVLLEDYYQILKALSINLKINYIPESLIFYRRHSNNITKTKIIQLEIQTTLLQLNFFRNKKFIRSIAEGVITKTNEYGGEYVRKIFLKYLVHPCRSNKVTWLLLKSLLKTK